MYINYLFLCHDVNYMAKFIFIITKLLSYIVFKILKGIFLVNTNTIVEYEAHCIMFYFAFLELSFFITN